MRSILIAASLVVAAFATAYSAGAQNEKKAPKKVTPAVQQGTSSFDPPRMIEIRPGTWVSSYGCVMDDGKRGLVSCSGGGGDLN